jgi:hypothetical protein
MLHWVIVGVVAGRSGAVITPPPICVKSTEGSSPAEAIVVEPAIVIAVEPAIVTAVEPAPTLEPAAAMRPSIGEIWLAERSSAQQSSCKDSGRLIITYPAPSCVDLTQIRSPFLLE